MSDNAELIARLRARDDNEHQTADMDALAAAAALEAAERQLAAAREALAEIARQKKTDELDTEYDVEISDFEGGYDMCIDRARAALANTDPAP